MSLKIGREAPDETTATAESGRPALRPDSPAEDGQSEGASSDLSGMSVDASTQMEAIAGQIEDLIRDAPDEVSRKTLMELAAAVGVQIPTQPEPERLSTTDLIALVSRLNEGGGKHGTGPENARELINTLRAYRDQPEVAEALIDSVRNQPDGGYYSATILQGTRHQPTIDRLRELLSESLDEKLWRKDDYRHVAQALRFSSDPEVPGLLLEALTNPQSSFSRNYRFEAAWSLGSMRDPEGEKVLMKIVFDHFGDWHVKRGAAYGLKAGLNDQIVAELAPLMGTQWEAAWGIASYQHSTTIMCWYKAINLWCNHRSRLNNARILAALILMDHSPDESKRVLKDVTRGKDASAVHAEFFAANDAVDALRLLEGKHP